MQARVRGATLNALMIPTTRRNIELSIATAFLIATVHACSRGQAARSTQSDGAAPSPTNPAVPVSSKVMAPNNSSASAPNVLPKLGAGVHQQVASLENGRELRYSISIPKDFEHHDKRSLVVVLHYGGKVTPFYGRGMLDELAIPALDSLGAILAAPDSLGGDWTNPDNEHAVVWLTETLLNVYALDRKRVALTGYSMGAAGTWFIAGRHSDLFSAALPVSGPAGAPGVEDFHTPLYVIHSARDEIFPVARTRDFVLGLRAKGANVEWTELREPTHYDVANFAPALAKAAPWLRAVWDR